MKRFVQRCASRVYYNSGFETVPLGKQEESRGILSRHVTWTNHRHQAISPKIIARF